MADKKISQLTAITGTVLDDADLIPVVDSSASETKKITFGEFKTALDQATGFVRITGDTMTGPLDVTGTVTADGLTVDGTATITDTGNVVGSNAPLLIKSNNGVATTSYGWDNLTSNYDYAIKTNGSERMRITSTGSVGIGTASPAYRLDVAADNQRARLLGVTGYTLLDVQNFGGSFTFGKEGASGGQLITGSAPYDSVIASQGAEPIHLATNSAIRMTVAAGGSVGIGTSIPAAPLHVQALGKGIQLNDGSNESGSYIQLAGSASYKNWAISNNFFSGGALQFSQSAAAGGVTPSQVAMTITSTGSVGIGTNSPAAQVHIAGQANGTLRVDSLSSGYLDLSMYSNGGFVATSAAQPLRLGTGNQERLRIDASGNVGINYTTPSILGTLVVAQKTSGKGIAIVDSAFSNSLFLENNTSQVDIGNNAAKPIVFSVNSAERLRLDASGNLGLGVVPKSWYTPLSVKALQVGSTTSLWALSNGPTDLRTTLDNNLYVSSAGANAYLSTGPASRYQQLNGNHVWHTVASGLADATATATERLRIDASGNLGLGVVPSAWTSGYSVLEGVNGQSISFSGNTPAFTSNGYVTGAGWTYKTSNYASNYYQYAGQHIWRTAPSGTAGSPITFSQAMTLDASGNLLVGQTSPSNSVAGMYVRPASSSGFIANNSHAVALGRLNSDGEVLQFLKDGTTVGSIGSNSSSIYALSGDTGILLYDYADEILPVGTSATTRDAAISLGRSATRFKDLYLSGGVYLGGTGAANKLDDYEEGTWTPVMVGTGVFISSLQRAVYKKVGALVFLQAYIGGFSGVPNGNIFKIGGLPFASNINGYAVCSLNAGISNASLTAPILRVASGTTEMIALKNMDTTVQDGELDGGHLIFSIVYDTDA